MVLDMKLYCEKCGAGLPRGSVDAYICSYECTFCSACYSKLSGKCPNCLGELMRRPRRLEEVQRVAVRRT